MTRPEQDGLSPQKGQSDALLLELLEIERRMKDLLGEDPSVEDALEHQRVRERIAALPARTLDGLRQKGDHALEEWRESGGPEGEIFDQHASLIVELLGVVAMLDEEEFSELQVRR